MSLRLLRRINGKTPEFPAAWKDSFLDRWHQFFLSLSLSFFLEKGAFLAGPPFVIPSLGLTLVAIVTRSGCFPSRETVIRPERPDKWNDVTKERWQRETSALFNY